MSATYTPYRDIAPKTTDLAVLRAELTRVRKAYGLRSSQSAEAFKNLCRESGRQGKPIDALRRDAGTDSERFFARTIPGSDGHIYWDGPRLFTRNDRRQRNPIRWWWEHVHGPLRSGDSIQADCGERNCINPEHAVHEVRAERHRLWRDDQLLGGLQVLAMQLGHAPTSFDWKKSGRQPSNRTFAHRFGSWTGALRAAGLEPHRTFQVATPATCVKSLQLARKILNRWPTSDDYTRREVLAALHEASLPSSNSTIYAHLGPTWADALRKAGNR